ncbi:hypothetical protein [Leeuwenhoekiella sp. LLG6367-2.1]|uniref:hypothetical protein n=1 Tax=Leeuwenhoekiella sp. LLG6367-2.1 TaxID=3160833 RepID=UPI00386ABE7F
MKSVRSAVNKPYINHFDQGGLIHDTVYKFYLNRKRKGSLSTLDDVENGSVPDDLQAISTAILENFVLGYRKSYL